MLRGALPPSRLIDASPLDIPLESIPGTYYDDAYGEIEVCAVSSNSGTSSFSCRETLVDNPFPLPKPGIPTFIAKYDKQAFDYLFFSHYNGSTFTVTPAAFFPERNETVVAQFEAFEAAFAEEGMAFGGNAWGADAGAGGEGKNSLAVGLREAAELRFEKRRMSVVK